MFIRIATTLSRTCLRFRFEVAGRRDLLRLTMVNADHSSDVPGSVLVPPDANRFCLPRYELPIFPIHTLVLVDTFVQ